MTKTKMAHMKMSTGTRKCEDVGYRVHHLAMLVRGPAVLNDPMDQD